MNSGLLYKAQVEGRAYEVAMDEVKFLAFGNGKPNSIGTANLNSCSAVVIVSTFGAILAHIPSLPQHTQDPTAGDRHAQTKMEEVAALYNANKGYFSTGGNNWVVCAVFRGEVALPDQQKIMQDGLTSLGLSHSLVTYVAGRKDNFAGKGTVFIDGRGQQPVVYVEDKDVSDGAQWASYATPSRTASYGTGSAAYPSTTSSYGTGSAAYPSTTSSYGTGSAAYPAAASSYGTGLTAYQSKASTSYSAGSSSYPSGSPGDVAGDYAQSSQAPYYYVRDKRYFLCDNGKHTLQSDRPKNVWVLNEKGWSGTDGMRWRYWDGKSISYSP